MDPDPCGADDHRCPQGFGECDRPGSRTVKVLPLPHSDATSLTSGAWTNIPSQTDIPGSGGLDVLTDPSPNGTLRFHRIGVRVP